MFMGITLPATCSLLRLEEHRVGREVTPSFPSTKAVMFLRMQMLLIEVRIHLPLSLHSSDLFQCYHGIASLLGSLSLR